MAVCGLDGKIDGAIIFPILLVTFLLKKSDKEKNLQAMQIPLAPL
jgi:hypothetical protein